MMNFGALEDRILAGAASPGTFLLVALLKWHHDSNIERAKVKKRSQDVVVALSRQRDILPFDELQSLFMPRHEIH